MKWWPIRVDPGLLIKILALKRKFLGCPWDRESAFPRKVNSKQVYEFKS